MGGFCQCTLEQVVFPWYVWRAPPVLRTSSNRQEQLDLPMSSLSRWVQCSKPSTKVIGLRSSCSVQVVFPAHPQLQLVRLPGCWWLVVGADLFWEKSTAGWLLVARLFWEKSTVGWWLISQANRVHGNGVEGLTTNKISLNYFLTIFLFVF
jgi:hypothetical protein